MPPVEGVGEVYVLEPAFAGAWGMSFAANLTPDAETGIGTWTEQQFLDTLRNGRHQGRGRQLLPPMPWPVFGQMDDADLKAMFAYLKTVPGREEQGARPAAAAAGECFGPLRTHDERGGFDGCRSGWLRPVPPTRRGRRRSAWRSRPT